MYNKELFSKKLVTLIYSRGYSQKGLAKKCGISESSLSRYIKGSRIPSADILCRIADVLDVSVDFLLDRPCVDLKDDNFGAILNCAVRYALGRRTYMVSLVIDYIVPLLPSLNIKTLECFGRDLYSYTQDVSRGLGTWGDDIDREAWFAFAEAVNEELKNRNKH